MKKIFITALFVFMALTANAQSRYSIYTYRVRARAYMERARCEDLERASLERARYRNTYTVNRLIEEQNDRIAELERENRSLKAQAKETDSTLKEKKEYWEFMGYASKEEYDRAREQNIQALKDSIVTARNIVFDELSEREQVELLSEAISEYFLHKGKN